ncbi:MAG TPA: cyclase family protein [Pirellulales bacterium]|nr:cyclase family protein [Pirellulales bacterium]
MRRWLMCCLALTAGMMVNLVLEIRERSQVKAADNADPAANQAAPASKPLTFLDAASGRARFVDLAWPLNATSAYWPGENYKPFELHTLATLEREGVLSKAFSSPEHLGTHLDAPNHFERDQISVDKITPEHLFSEGILIDVSAAAASDADYRVSVDDIARHETQHGRIPQSSVVLAYTGWSRFWHDRLRYQNQDLMGHLHFPGFSAEAARLLIDERQVRGLGLDTLSVDYGLSRDFVVHHLLGKAGCYGLENLAGLEKLPPRGFFLVVAPMKIETGSGAPTRVFAVLH